MKIEVTPRPHSGEIMFSVHQPHGTRRVYWKGWWRGHLHALRLIFAGHDLHYVDPDA